MASTYNRGQGGESDYEAKRREHFIKCRGASAKMTLAELDQERPFVAFNSEMLTKLAQQIPKGA